MEPSIGKLGREYKQIAFDKGLPGRDMLEHTLIEQTLRPFLEEITVERQKEIETISHHMEISLNAIIDRVQCQFAELVQMKEAGSKESGLDGRIKQFEERLFELNARLERRREELQQERHCTIADIQHQGRAWVLPHPEDPQTAIEVRFIEVKGRAVVGEVVEI